MLLCWEDREPPLEINIFLSENSIYLFGCWRITQATKTNKFTSYRTNALLRKEDKYHSVSPKEHWNIYATLSHTRARTVGADVGTRGFSEQPWGRDTSSHIWIPALFPLFQSRLRAPEECWAGQRHPLTSASPHPNPPDKDTPLTHTGSSTPPPASQLDLYAPPFTCATGNNSTEFVKSRMVHLRVTRCSWTAGSRDRRWSGRSPRWCGCNFRRVPLNGSLL